METMHKAVNLPKVGNEFNYGDKVCHISVDDKGRYTLWEQYGYQCHLSGTNVSDLEKGLISWFGMPEKLMYNDKPVFVKRVEVKPGQIYISRGGDKWLVVADSGQFSLVSIPEFYMQGGWKQISKELMRKQLEESSYVLTEERFK